MLCMSNEVSQQRSCKKSVKLQVLLNDRELYEHTTLGPI